MYDNESLDREKFYFQIEGEESKNWRGGEGKLVHAQDYRTFCREIGPGEGLLRQSDYGGRRVSMGEQKKGGGGKGRGGKKRKKRERGKKSAIPNNERGRVNVGGGGGDRGGVAFFRGELIDFPLARSLAPLGVTPPLPHSPSFLAPLLALRFSLSLSLSLPLLFLSRIRSLARSLARSNKSFP